MAAEQGGFTGRVFSADALHIQQQAPEELFERIRDIRTFKQSRQFLEYAANHFQMPLSKELLSSQVLNLPLDINADYQIATIVYRARNELPPDFSVYNVFGFGQYILDWRRDVGSRFLPADRASRIAFMPKEVQQFMRFCSDVQVYDQITLESRLTQTELAIIERIASGYPQAVGREEISDGLWNGHVGLDACNSALYTAVSRIRGKLDPYQTETHEILGENRSYRLSLS
jgi:hypothetical protein